jgi:uncharacterized protein YndB with AHSA1/START domain
MEGTTMQIEVRTTIKADPETVWRAWNTPEDIQRWNTPTPEWHTPRATVDLRVGGQIRSRMEARDGSMGFDFVGTYTKIDPPRSLAFTLEDGRKVTVEFEETEDGVLVRERFDAETENDPEMQRAGWQAILDSFKRYVEEQ